MPHLITMALNADGSGVVYLDGKELDTVAVRIAALAGSTPLVTLVVRAAVQATLPDLPDSAVELDDSPPAGDALPDML